VNSERLREQIKWNVIDALRRRVFISVLQRHEEQRANPSENDWVWQRIGSPIREQIVLQTMHSVWNHAHYRFRRSRSG
jgi:hypothetical protein